MADVRLAGAEHMVKRARCRFAGSTSGTASRTDLPDQRLRRPADQPRVYRIDPVEDVVGAAQQRNAGRRLHQ